MYKFIIFYILFSNMIGRVNSQIIDKSHFIESSDILYDKLISYISQHEKIIDKKISIEYVSLIDSNAIDNYGIFLFDLAQLPSFGVYLMYRNKHSDKIFIVKNYKLKNVYKTAFRFFKENDISNQDQVKFLYSLARFYDDYVFIENGRKSKEPKY